MASGFYARPMDYARLGRLVLNKGVWEGEQLISPDWIQESTTADLVAGDPAEYYQADPEDEDNYFVDFFFGKNGYYAYQWWGIRDAAAGTMILASGMYGQYIAIVPEKNLLILRFGDDPGEIFSWADVFVEIAEGM